MPAKAPAGNPNSLLRRFAVQPGEPLEDARVLPLAAIDPNPAQSRQVFDEAALQELAESIRAHGVLEPILVRPVGPRWQVVAGERRVRAARLAGLDTIPALIREYTDEQAAYVTAIENLQREDLDIEDEARWFAYLQEVTGVSGRELARQLGKSDNYINRRLSLLRYPDLMLALRDSIMTQREALLTASYRDSHADWETTHPIDETLVAVMHGASVRAEDSTEPEDVPEPPRLVERAALDSVPRAPRPAPSADSRVPYRARALDSAATTFLRMDWTSVPRREAQTVIEQITLIETALADAKAALAASLED